MLDSGERRLDLEPVDATAVVTDVLLGFYVGFERKGVEPTVDLPRSRCGCWRTRPPWPG